jgi:hypothetical protein
MLLMALEQFLDVYHVFTAGIVADRLWLGLNGLQDKAIFRQVGVIADRGNTRIFRYDCAGRHVVDQCHGSSPVGSVS